MRSPVGTVASTPDHDRPASRATTSVQWQSLLPGMRPGAPRRNSLLALFYLLFVVLLVSVVVNWLVLPALVGAALGRVSGRSSVA